MRWILNPARDRTGPGGLVSQQIALAPDQGRERHQVAVRAAIAEAQQQGQGPGAAPTRLVCAPDPRQRPQLLAVAELSALPVEEGQQGPVGQALGQVLAAESRAGWRRWS